MWVLALAGVFLAPARAFWVGEHEALTRAAFQEAQECLPALKSESFQQEIISANLDEDRNIVRKWSRDSHYYSPVRELSMWRRTSMDRILDIQGDTRSNITWVIGVLLHHIQDAAVPAHVVPINHWIDDGFEAFEAGVPEPDTACSPHGAFVEMRRPSEVLQRMAELTLYAAVDTHPWNRFWREGSGKSFGSYGELGDVFGRSNVLSQEDYRRFKLAQARLALDASKWVLRWGLVRMSLAEPFTRQLE